MGIHLNTCKTDIKIVSVLWACENEGEGHFRPALVLPVLPDDCTHELTKECETEIALLELLEISRDTKSSAGFATVPTDLERSHDHINMQSVSAINLSSGYVS